MKLKNLFLVNQPDLLGGVVSDAQVKESTKWRRAAVTSGVACVALLAVYFGTDWLPRWFGYVLGPLGLGPWYCFIQAQEARRPGHRR